MPAATRKPTPRKRTASQPPTDESIKRTLTSFAESAPEIAQGLRYIAGLAKAKNELAASQQLREQAKVLNDCAKMVRRILKKVG